jgi:hypothetical protein
MMPVAIAPKRMRTLFLQDGRMPDTPRNRPDNRAAPPVESRAAILFSV